MDINYFASCRTLVILYFVVNAAMHLNGNVVDGESLTGIEEKEGGSDEKWKQEDKERLDAVIESIYENKDRISNLAETVVKVKPLLEQLCKYETGYECLELVEPEILNIIERAAKEKERKNGKPDKKLICELINKHCKDGKLSRLDEDDHIAEGTHIVPIKVKSENAPVNKNKATPTRKCDNNKKNCDDKYPCKNCIKSPLIDLLTILSVNENLYKKEYENERESSKNSSRKRNNSNGKANDSQNQGRRSVDEESEDEEDEFEETSAPDEDSDPSDETVEDRADENEELILEKRIHLEPEEDDVGYNDKSGDVLLSEDDVPEIQDKKLAEISDALFRLCAQPIGTNDLTHNCPPNSKSKYPHLQLPSIGDHLPTRFSYTSDGRQYLREPDSLVKQNELYNKIISLPHSPNLVDPNLYYNWMKPNYQKDTYFKDVNSFESPSGTYSSTYCCKSDTQGYVEDDHHHPHHHHHNNNNIPILT